LNQTQNNISPNLGIQIYNMAIQILNTGISMLNIANQISNMGNDAFNYGLQIENIGMQIQNIGNQIKYMNNMNNMNNMCNENNMNNNMNFPNNMPNSMMGMGGMGMMMMNMNMNNDEEWMKGFKMASEEINDEIKDEIKILFKTTQGIETNIFAKKGTTIDEIIKKYLNDVNKPELIKQENSLTFLFNAQRLKLGDKRKIENFFKNVSDPLIFVNDINNLIGV
jgi:hypothetical protein